MGPTASGKTALASTGRSAWAAKSSASIRRWSIAGSTSARPSPTRAERAQVPHHLIDLREPWQPYSAAEFAADAQARHRRHRRPRSAADPGWRHRAVFPRAAGGTVRHARGRSRTARRACRGSRPARLGQPACRAGRGSIPPPPRASTPPTRSASSVRWRSTGSAGAPSATGSAPLPASRLPLRVLKLVLAPPRRRRSPRPHRGPLRRDAGGRLPRRSPRAARCCRNLPRIRSRWTCRRCVRWAIDRRGSTWTARHRLRNSGSARIAATRQLAKRQLTWLRGELDARWFDPARQRDALDAAVDGFLGRSGAA